MSAFRNLIAVAMFNVWVYFAVSNLLLFQSGISEPVGHYVFETFANFWRVSVSVWENLVSNKKSQFQKIWSRRKSLGFGFRKFGLE